MSLEWLRHIRRQVLYPIFAGLLGLIIFTSLLITKCTSDQQIKEIAYREARRAQQLQEGRQRALAEQQRLEAERKKREDQEQLRLSQLNNLRQLGVRGVPMHAVQSDPFHHLGVWMQVRSEPESADVYFNWAHKGKTPLWLNGAEIAGLLLIVKDARAAWFHDITPNHNGALSATLGAIPPRPRSQLMFTLAASSPEGAFAVLRSRLAASGFTIPEATAAADFQRMAQAAGGVSNDGFRAWARAKFSSDTWLRASVRERHRDLGAQSRVLAGSVRVFVELDFDVYDLTSGEHRALINAAESAFAIDPAQGFQKALDAAAVAAVDKLRARMVE
jgi:hypothetical protein